MQMGRAVNSAVLLLLTVLAISCANSALAQADTDPRGIWTYCYATKNCVGYPLLSYFSNATSIGTDRTVVTFLQAGGDCLYTKSVGSCSSGYFAVAISDTLAPISGPLNTCFLSEQWPSCIHSCTRPGLAGYVAIELSLQSSANPEFFEPPFEEKKRFRSVDTCSDDDLALSQDLASTWEYKTYTYPYDQLMLNWVWYNGDGACQEIYPYSRANETQPKTRLYASSSSGACNPNDDTYTFDVFSDSACANKLETYTIPTSWEPMPIAPTTALALKLGFNQISLQCLKGTYIPPGNVAPKPPVTNFAPWSTAPVTPSPVSSASHPTLAIASLFFIISSMLL